MAFEPNELNLLPQEPPPFMEVIPDWIRAATLHSTPRSVIDRLRRRGVPRGLDWLLRKHEIPAEDLEKIQRRAYPLREKKFETAWKDEVVFISQFRRILPNPPARLGEASNGVSTLLPQLIDSPETLRITDWTAALMLAFDESMFAKRLSRAAISAFGADVDDRQPEEKVFGVFIYTNEIDKALKKSIELAVDKHRFPVTIRVGTWLKDADLKTVHPINGTAACWAKSLRQPKSPQIGFLTAAHLLIRPAKGKKVRTHFGTAVVIDVAPGAPTGIDAMLLRPRGAKTILAAHKRLSALEWVNPFVPVEFTGAQSGLIKTKITQVDQLFASLDPRFPARVILDDPGRPGDSGALIRLDSGIGIALYTGRFRDKNRREWGIGIHLAQIAHCMSLELYEF